MLADALGVEIEQATIRGLYDNKIVPPASVELVPGYSLSSAIVIALAGQAVDECLLVDTTPCDANHFMYETDRLRLEQCLITVDGGDQITR